MKCIYNTFIASNAYNKLKPHKGKSIICATLLIALLLYGCVKTPPNETVRISGKPVTEQQIMHMFSKDYAVLDWKPLTIGGALVVCKAPDSGDMRRFFLFWRDDETAYAQETYFVYNLPLVNIFYDADWQTKHCNYLSQYIIVEADGHKDALIFVMQNFDYEHKTAYEASPMYGIKPYDTLGTEPLTVHDPNWYKDYPMWVFDVPMEEIDETYALTYGDWVLTGEDIMNHTWQNGDAPIME